MTDAITAIVVISAVILVVGVCLHRRNFGEAMMIGETFTLRVVVELFSETTR
jgi:hypothetical protein